ncbi:hypothetical protein [Nocardia thailandica]
MADNQFDDRAGSNRTDRLQQAAHVLARAHTHLDRASARHRRWLPGARVARRGQHLEDAAHGLLEATSIVLAAGVDAAAATRGAGAVLSGLRTAFGRTPIPATVIDTTIADTTDHARVSSSQAQIEELLGEMARVARRSIIVVTEIMLDPKTPPPLARTLHPLTLLLRGLEECFRRLADNHHTP